jgi:hypothetical protein
MRQFKKDMINFYSAKLASREAHDYFQSEFGSGARQILLLDPAPLKANNFGSGSGSTTLDKSEIMYIYRKIQVFFL